MSDSSTGHSAESDVFRLRSLQSKITVFAEHDGRRALPLSALATHLLPRHGELDLLDVVRRRATVAIDEHPYLYPNEAVLWVVDPTTLQWMLTSRGVLFAIDAWSSEANLSPASYADDEHTTLQMWRCHGGVIVQRLFASAVEPLQPELEQRLSNMRFHESVREYAAQHDQRAPRYNRERYAARFSRIQAYGLEEHVDAATGAKRTHAFFLPAGQILASMSGYLRSSTLFEEHRWRSTGSYLKYAQFTNIMLLNLCSEIQRQITTMFRLQEQQLASGAATDQLLMPADAVFPLSDGFAGELATLTERITGHPEQINWMPPLSVNLQRFLQASTAGSSRVATPTSTAAATPATFAIPVTPSLDMAESRLNAPLHHGWAPTMVHAQAPLPAAGSKRPRGRPRLTKAIDSRLQRLDVPLKSANPPLNNSAKSPVQMLPIESRTHTVVQSADVVSHTIINADVSIAATEYDDIPADDDLLRVDSGDEG